MRLLITGGAGFIGTNLVRLLLATKEAEAIEAIVIVDALTYAGSSINLQGVHQDTRVIFIHAEIQNGPLIGSILFEHKIASVIHLAAETHVDRSIDSPRRFVDTNIVGTFELLEAYLRCLKNRPAPGRRVFVHVSTDEVFGSLGENDMPFRETTNYSPSSPYSASKAASDHLVAAYKTTFGLPVITTHCGNNFGPFQFPEKLIPLMIQKTLADQPLPIYGDGSNRRDWIHVNDHCRALILLLMKGIIGSSYVIGSRCEISNREVAQLTLQAVHKAQLSLEVEPSKSAIIYVSDRPGHDARYAIDPTKIEGEFGWKPLETFEGGLEKTVWWYLENAEWSRKIAAKIYQGQRLGMPESR